MNNRIFEITHDSLAAKIWEKVSSEEKGIMEVQSFITSSYQIYKTRKVLLSKQDISYIQPYIGKINSGEEEIQFIGKSKAFYKRRRLFIVSAIIIVFILLCFGILYANDARNKALRAKKVAEITLKHLLSEQEKRTQLEIERLFATAISYIDAGYDKDAAEKIKEILAKDSSEAIKRRIRELNLSKK
jgi:hypothetical protein